MFRVDLDNKITITRGDDSGLHPFLLNIGTKLNPIRYVLENEDKVYVGVFHANGCFENAVLKKVFTAQDLIDEVLQISFNSQDTINLKEGQYFYQLKLRTGDMIKTLVDKKPFNVI